MVRKVQQVGASGVGDRKLIFGHCGTVVVLPNNGTQLGDAVEEITHPVYDPTVVSNWSGTVQTQGNGTHGEVAQMVERVEQWL